MSLKLVEMQFAFHKNDEVGIKQQQLNHKPGHDQSQLADATDKQTIKERQVSARLEETTGAAIRDGGQPSQGKREQDHRAPKKRKNESRPEAADPYKGRHFDVSL